jgi:hypothetical protein
MGIEIHNNFKILTRSDSIWSLLLSEKIKKERL